MRASWYFDFVSPYSYIALYRLKELPASLEVHYRPVLFAGLLERWGQKGPAEVAGKRRWTYRWCTWWAARFGVPLRFPATHPFNPLHHLRLAIAVNDDPPAIKKIFDDIWSTGLDAADPARFAALCKRLGVDQDILGTVNIKETLRRKTEEAAELGIFGVPTLLVDGEQFWGADGIDFAKAFLADPTVLRNPEMQRIDALPVGAARRT